MKMNQCGGDHGDGLVGLLLEMFNTYQDQNKPLVG